MPLAKINTSFGHSTTTPERYIHVTDGKYRGTVFFRQNTDTLQWHAAAANLHHADNFSRPKGRSVARRKFFAGEFRPLDVEFPSRETAIEVLEATSHKH